MLSLGICRGGARSSPIRLLRVGLMVPAFCVCSLLLFGRPACAEDEPANPATPEAAPEKVEKAKPADGRDAAYDEIELLAEAMLHIRKNYVTEKTYKELVHGALDGMLRSLDEYSTFMEPEAYNELQEDTSGKFGGIGIQLGVRNGVLTVIAPIEDTPAFRAGLQSGDRIIEIDGKSTQGLSMRDAVGKLRGQKGTKVTLKVQGEQQESAREVTLVRDEIDVPSVKGERILRDGIGYVRVTQFAAPTAASLKDALDRLAAKGMKSLILDLRGNPGGLLKSAVDVSELFLKRNELIVSTKGREGVHETTEIRASGGSPHAERPMAILVNRGSASASEIVAGAMQDHGRAILVGDTTFGKGSVQSVIRMRPEGKAEDNKAVSESAIRLTTAMYYTPSGRLIHNKGIDPDIRVDLPPEEWRKVQVRRAHIENPGSFSDEDKKPYLDVVDRQMERAADMLAAVTIFSSRKTK